MMDDSSYGLRAAASPACAWQRLPLTNLEEFHDFGRTRSNVCWDVCHERNTSVIPSLMDLRIGDVRFRKILTGPCRGHRGPVEIKDVDRPYFCLSFITQGFEIVDDGVEKVRCGPGDIATWHSGQTLSFEVTEAREKLAIYVPEESMAKVLFHPTSYAGLHLKRNSGIGALLAGYLGGLCDDFEVSDNQTEAEIEEITLDLIGSAIAAHRKLRSRAQQPSLFDRIVAFIDRNLENPDLRPTHIASALGISLRYLHLVFANQGQGHTVVSWIRSQRLTRCRADLARSAGSSTITEVAFRGGFNDAAHFSRTFKARYGLSPSLFRTAEKSAHRQSPSK